jgi:hypothetical protein
MTNHPHPRSFDLASADAAEVACETLSDDVACGRHDGWTARKQAAFLRELAATQNVSAAARAVGMTRQSAYRLRARLKGQPFDMAWDAAFYSCFDALAEQAMARAMNGVEVPHFHKGELIGTSRKYDERLTLGLLNMRGAFLRAPMPPYHPAADFEAEDVARLIERVETGPDHWDGQADE